MTIFFLFLLTISVLSIVHGVTLPLWPQPVTTVVGNTKITLSPEFHFYQRNPSHRFSDRLIKSMNRYEKRVQAFYNNAKQNHQDDNDVKLDRCEVVVNNIIVDNVDEVNTLDLNVDESYFIDISDHSCVIKSETIWGSMHGLDTFIQLLTYDDDTSSVICSYLPVTISDYPRYSHRGLLIDTSRHYLPTETIFALLDSFAMNKLNVLHWHMTDAESFPLNSVTEPLMVKGAYTETKIYTLDDIQALTAYAADRGIRIIVEIDVPGHTGSWLDGKPEIMADCIAKYTNVENYALNPSVDDAYDTIVGIVKDLISAQAPYNMKYLHLGGDETVYGCWANDTSITSFMTEEGILTYNDLYNYFVNRTDTLITSSFPVDDNTDLSIIHWEEVYFAGAQVPDNTIFQVWTDASKMAEVADAGHPILASPSDYWYLNYVAIDWKTMYAYDPTTNLTSSQANQLIGGEACVWGELVDESNLQATIYPRLSAVAERLWSPITVTNQDDAKARLTIQRCRFVQQGFHSAAIQPDYCYTQYV